MHRYKYTILFLITLLLAWAVGKITAIDHFATAFAQTNALLFTFIAGAMYSFSFTAGLAVLLFAHLPVVPESILPLALIGASGGLIADLLIFRFVKNVLFHELGPHAENYVKRVTRSHTTRIIFQVIGAAIIASPFPDEIGLTFMGLSRISFWRLVVLTFILDTLGVYLLILAVSNL